MTEHDTNAPLTEDDVAAIEARMSAIMMGATTDSRKQVRNRDVRRLVADWRRLRAENARLTRLAFEAVVQLDDQDFARMKGEYVLGLGRIYDEAPDKWLDASTPRPDKEREMGVEVGTPITFHVGQRVRVGDNPLIGIIEIISADQRSAFVRTKTSALWVDFPFLTDANYPINIIATPVLFRVDSEFVEADTANEHTDLTFQQTWCANSIRLSRALVRFGQSLVDHFAPFVEALSRIAEQNGLDR